MRNIALTLVAVLAMTSATSAVELGYVRNADPTGYEDVLRSFTLQATGIGINTLSQFTVTGNVNQVWTWVTGWPGETVPSEWLGDGSASGHVADSYVIFGDMRIADMPNYYASGAGPGPQITEEILPGASETYLEGLGTMSNYDAGAPTWDGYLQLGAPSIVEETVDLLQLIVPYGEVVTVSLSLVTVEDDGSGDPYPFVLTTVHDFVDFQIPYDGDADSDGDVDIFDLSTLGGNYDTATGMEWEDGDFDFDGDVDIFDLSSLGANYGKGTGGSEGNAPIPEPSTLILLVLGGLCLVGYRLRK